MTIYTKYVVFPDGSRQEISTNLRVNQLVDVNGNPLQLPVPTSKMIAYRVTGKRTREEIGEENVYYSLELVWEEELREYV